MIYNHPEVELVGLGSQNYAGKQFSEVYPHFRGSVDIECRSADDPELLEMADVVFLALPHGLSVPFVEAALKLGKKVVDLGADFRLKSPSLYRQWYQQEGPVAILLDKAVYGLPEIYRDELEKAGLVANPGCYPTTAILGLAPLLKEKLIETGLIIIDSKSGVSGAGRNLKTTSLFAEVEGDFKAYGLPHHRHTPEIEQELSRLAGEEIKVSFTPHLVPMTRGMLSTIYAVSCGKASPKEVEECYRDFYRDKPFVRVYPQGEFPQTKWVLGTNYCDIGFCTDERTGRLVIVSVIDNLVKGASGQAVQNMNIICGFDESQGLDRIAIYP